MKIIDRTDEVVVERSVTVELTATEVGAILRAFGPLTSKQAQASPHNMTKEEYEAFSCYPDGVFQTLEQEFHRGSA